MNNLKQLSTMFACLDNVISRCENMCINDVDVSMKLVEITPNSEMSLFHLKFELHCDGCDDQIYMDVDPDCYWEETIEYDLIEAATEFVHMAKENAKWRDEE